MHIFQQFLTQKELVVERGQTYLLIHIPIILYSNIFCIIFLCGIALIPGPYRAAGSKFCKPEPRFTIEQFVFIALYASYFSVLFISIISRVLVHSFSEFCGISLMNHSYSPKHLASGTVIGNNPDIVAGTFNVVATKGYRGGLIVECWFSTADAEFFGHDYSSSSGSSKYCFII